MNRQRCAADDAERLGSVSHHWGCDCRDTSISRELIEPAATPVQNWAFRASLVGYTNEGKSSIVRAIGNAPEVFVENRLFATLDPLTREVDLRENSKVLLTDTVGFIRKLPHNLVASFRATLEEVNEADLLLRVIDASHPAWEEQREVVDQVLADPGAKEKPVLYVFSKIDAVPPAELSALQIRIENLIPNSVFVSSVAADDLEPPTLNAVPFAPHYSSSIFDCSTIQS